MAEAKPLNPGDPCPNCSGTLEPVPQPTAQQRQLAANRDNPIPLPPFVDTASEEQIRELGDLHRCGRCGYITRFRKEGADSGGGRGAESSSTSRGGGQPGGGDDELARLRRENDQMRQQLAASGGGGGGAR